ASSLLLFQDSAKARGFVLSLLEGSGLPSEVMLLIGLLSSYLVSILLGAIGFYILDQEWNEEPPKLSFGWYPDRHDPYIVTSFMYDAIQHHDPQAGARLAKLSAERHMCNVLIVGFGALALAELYLTGARWLAIALFIAIASAAYLVRRYLKNRSLRLRNVLTVGFAALGLVGLYIAGARSEGGWKIFALFAAIAASSWLFRRHLRIRSARLLANHWYSLDLEKKTRKDAGDSSAGQRYPGSLCTPSVRNLGPDRIRFLVGLGFKRRHEWGPSGGHLRCRKRGR